MATRSADDKDRPSAEATGQQLIDRRRAGAVEHAYWSFGTDQLVEQLETATSGLLSADAATRLAKFGRNALTQRSSGSAFTVFVRQFRSPLVLILVFASVVSVFVGEGHEAAIIGAIVLAGCILSFT